MASEFLWKDLNQNCDSICHDFHPHNSLPPGGKRIRKHKLTLGGYSYSNSAVIFETSPEFSFQNLL